MEKSPPPPSYHHISFSCLVAHRAFTELLHSSLLVAAVRTSSHDLQPASCLSFSTVRLQVVFGLPLLLLPSGAQLMATLQSSLRSFLRIWPIIFHLRDITSTLSGFMLALSSSSLVLTWSCHRIRKILRRHLLWNTFTDLSSPLFIFSSVLRLDQPNCYAHFYLEGKHLSDLCETWQTVYYRCPY